MDRGPGSRFSAFGFQRVLPVFGCLWSLVLIMWARLSAICQAVKNNRDVTKKKSEIVA